MPVCQVDEVVGGVDGLFPGIWFACCAASAANVNGGESTRFNGIFVDGVGMSESYAVWDVIHSALAAAPEISRVRERVADQDRVEFGAIAVIAAVLWQREGLRVGNVRQIGSRSDYGLLNRCGGAVGAIEFAGLRGKYTSDNASRKRANVKLSLERPARIGIVAFGGPELRVEVVA